MRAKIDELWPQTCVIVAFLRAILCAITTIFQYNILCILTLVTRKLQVVCGRSAYQMTAQPLGMSIFYIRVGVRYKW